MVEADEYDSADGGLRPRLLRVADSPLSDTELSGRAPDELREVADAFDGARLLAERAVLALVIPVLHRFGALHT